jgi:hypothetical protein
MDEQDGTPACVARLNKVKLDATTCDLVVLHHLSPIGVVVAEYFNPAIRRLPTSTISKSKEVLPDVRKAVNVA